MARAGARVERADSAQRRGRDGTVMDAAISVMSERGYAATSIQEVAARVGVLKGSLYYYFSSKEELLFRILEESHLEFRELIASISELELSPLEELCEYVRRLAVWYLEHIERANIYFTEARHLTGERRATMSEYGREFERVISDLVARGQQAGQIDDGVESRIITRFVLGALNNVRAWPSRSGKGFSTEELADGLVTLTRRAISSGDPA